MTSHQFAPDAEHLDGIGRGLAAKLKGGDTCHLHGPLGAGKTTLARGILRGRGYSGVVPSPTYTLIETYPLGSVLVVHFDLFRIESHDELEPLGLRDYFSEDTICLIEWPDRAVGYLPPPTVLITLAYREGGRQVMVDHADRED